MTNKLFIPGPTEVRQEVLEALSHGQVGHRTPEFRELFSSLKPGLKKLFSTENDVLISTSSGSGFWEASIRSCVKSKVLHACNGSFSNKWSKLSESCGRDVTRIKYDWGQAVKAEDVDKSLSENQYEAFCMVHNETSTGTSSDLEAISEVMKKYPDVLWFVDAVSSIAGMKVDVDRLGIDICLTSSQKAIALPPGLALASISQRCYDKAGEVEGRGYYFDLLELKKMYDKDMTPYTPSIPHLYALQKQLQRFEAEGLEARYARQKEMAEYVRSWALEKGFELFSESPSDTITCIKNTKGIDMVKVKEDMATKGYSIDSGYGKLNKQLEEEGKPTTFRIAHMGDLTLEEIKELTQELEKYFEGDAQ